MKTYPLVSSFHHLDKSTITRCSHKSGNIIKEKIPPFYLSVFWKVLQNPVFKTWLENSFHPTATAQLNIQTSLFLPQHMYNIGLHTCSHSQSSIALHTAQLMTQTAFVNMFTAIFILVNETAVQRLFSSLSTEANMFVGITHVCPSRLVKRKEMCIFPEILFTVVSSVA